MQADVDAKTFEEWVDKFKAKARQLGVSPATLDAAFQTVHFNPEIVAKDRNQPEFTLPIWDYLDRAVSAERISQGRRVLNDHSALLASIEDRFFVDRRVVAAIWGLESAYGKIRGDCKVIEALASLAFDGRRRELFESQLLSALEILQAGDITQFEMLGSWAGAMGHTQFMPSSYRKHAVDFDGDGARDIWSDDPTDALASTAAYLADCGWEKNGVWACEVTLPEGFDFGLSGKQEKRSFSQWASLGVVRVSDINVRDNDLASIIVPAGWRGPALMIFENFHVISKYNAADAYVIAVGHLSDRFCGLGAFQTAWPRQDRPLNSPGIKEIQERLSKIGYDTQGADGLIGPNTTMAIRDFQHALSVPQDGYPSFELLERLRRH